MLRNDPDRPRFLCDANHCGRRFSVRLMSRSPRRSDTDSMSSKAKISTAADGGRKSGRAVFDNQGRASWEWQTATGVYETNVTHEQLQHLEAAGLALVESEPAAAHGRVWANAARPRVLPERDQPMLKRLLRRLSG